MPQALAKAQGPPYHFIICWHSRMLLSSHCFAQLWCPPFMVYTLPAVACSACLPALRVFLLQGWHIRRGRVSDPLVRSPHLHRGV